MHWTIAENILANMFAFIKVYNNVSFHTIQVFPDEYKNHNNMYDYKNNYSKNWIYQYKANDITAQEYRKTKLD